MACGNAILKNDKPWEQEAQEWFVILMLNRCAEMIALGECGHGYYKLLKMIHLTQQAAGTAGLAGHQVRFKEEDAELAKRWQKHLHAFRKRLESKREATNG